MVVPGMAYDAHSNISSGAGTMRDVRTAHCVARAQRDRPRYLVSIATSGYLAATRRSEYPR
eukprot:1364930-Rhodomonas_salina.1